MHVIDIYDVLHNSSQLTGVFSLVFSQQQEARPFLHLLEKKRRGKKGKKGKKGQKERKPKHKPVPSPVSVHSDYEVA
jgi:hypothetical protein